MTILRPLLLIPFLAACQPLGLMRGDDAPQMEAPETDGAPLSAEAQDEADVEGGEEASETSAGAVTGSLGTSVASLGTATEQGMWIKTALVSAPQPGRVRAADTGREVAVTLRPLAGGAAGSGARLSLQAMQGLGLPLTALAEVEIFGG